MSIREMKADDLKRIVELEKDLFLSPWNEEDFIHELKENPMAGYYILEKENQIIDKNTNLFFITYKKIIINKNYVTV